MRALNSVRMGGRDVLPIIEGGKGVSVSDGVSSGRWAQAGGVGTFSAVNADSYDAAGNIIPQKYRGRTRAERHEEMVEFAIAGGIAQARRAHDVNDGRGRIHANILWEMGAAERVITGVLEGAKGLVHGLTCGAGMPYRLSEIASRFGVHYYPIISSARAFNALWRRAYHKAADLLGGVVYEDPWLAGGHNGISNSDDPRRPEPPLPRVLELRRLMRSFGLGETPIIMAGGIWWLEEWEEWIDNPDLGPIAFQFGTRPLLTQESPISDSWKQRLMALRKDDVLLQRFSPTGFYSSAVRNEFLADLVGRSERQVAFAGEPIGEHVARYAIGPRGRQVFLAPADLARVRAWEAEGYTEALRTPDTTLVFVSPDKAAEIRADQIACMGCLSECRFSNWSERGENHSNGRKADPRSFCIQKTLQDVAHDMDDPAAPERNLMFAGRIAHRFATDPFYSNNFVPTVRQLVERIVSGR